MTVTPPAVFTVLPVTVKVAACVVEMTDPAAFFRMNV